MAEYIDKQTALEIIASFRTPYRKELRVEDVYDAVSKADAVEIIHCKDCKHYYFADNRVEAEQCYVCGYWDFDSPSPNGFCSFAERREDG